MDAAICVFAWDLADEGIDSVLEYLADLGLTTLFLSSVYHAGWFVLPHNPRRTCYMPEDGAVYFNAKPGFFEDTPLKPVASKLAQEADWFAEVGRRMDRFGLRLTAWTVCNHSTRLGLAHPEHTVRNALGDLYPHALTPASPAVRSYVRGLARNLASQYPLQSIFLEAPNYRGRQHGHHHERDLLRFGALENELLDISFSEHDLLRAEAAGIDGEAVRLPVAEHLRRYLDSAPNFPAGLPRTMADFCELCPDLQDYRRELDRVVATLTAEIHDDIAPYGVKLEGFETLEAYDWQLVDGYGCSPDKILEQTRTARTHAFANQRLRTALFLGFDQQTQRQPIGNLAECVACVDGARQGGADGVFFFNYSEVPRGVLDWIKPALSTLPQTVDQHGGKVLAP